MTECKCGKPGRDDSYFCDDCGHALSVALGEIPWLDDELETTISRQRGVDYRTKGGSGGRERPMPLDWSPVEARTHLKSVLVAWVLFCAQEGVRNQSPSQEIPADNLPAISRWLMWRVDGLGLLDIGPEAVDEITDAVAHCRRLVDRPADKWFAGPCDECEVDMYARAGAKKVTCSACNLVYDMAERRAWLLKEAEESLANAVEIARAVSWLGAVPLTSDRVRQWASRDRITVRGHDRRGNPLYRVGDAIDLLSKSTTREPA